ncbi:MAG: ABC transporter substrate-binding protein [Bacteroidales bacterium]|nr:ABC transporter substrate-binding protein [Bacteroidales bacterium]
MRLTKPTILFAAIVLLCSCSKHRASIEEFTPIYTPTYAVGFEMSSDGENVIIETHNAWQGENASHKGIFISRNGDAAPEGFQGQTLDGEARRIVAMSSTFVAMLDAIGEADRVVGVSGKDFINTPSVAARYDEIGDVGYEGHINYETLLALEPDLVLLYSINGASSMEPKLIELGIPYVYVGEYLEESPLGKAEWMIPMGEMVGQRAKAEEVYSAIPENYNQLKARMSNVAERPRVMLNLPYGDSWVMPSATSYMAQLINDAGGQCAYQKDTGNQSKPIDMEEAYLLANGADYWLNVGSVTSERELRSLMPKFADVKPVREHHVYNNNLRLNPTGGNDYWESGTVNPDLILQDLILILHPDSLPGSQFTYYRHVE